MSEGPKKPEEVVWSGESDRQMRDDSAADASPVTETENQGPEDPPSPPQSAAPEAPPPEPGPAEKPPVMEDPAIPSPAEQSRALAVTVVASFGNRMKAEALRKGGVLNSDDINALDNEFKEKIDVLQAMFEKSFEDYVVARERAVWDQKRDFPFDRQIVDKFSHLFPSPVGLSLADGAVSRRVLPGFFVALNLMLGEEATEGYQNRCRAAVDRLKGEHGREFTWEDVQDDKEIEETTIDAVVAMAEHFEDLDKRADWFINVVNSHLAPADAGREGADALVWEMDETTFWTFLHALYSDVRRLTSSEPGRLQIAMRYGGETCAFLVEFMNFLEDEVAE
jgi:hypothetical protein